VRLTKESTLLVKKKARASTAGQMDQPTMEIGLTTKSKGSVPTSGKTAKSVMASGWKANFPATEF
jgi:hypothetical protein